MADGWIGYALDPERYRAGLETIARAASQAGRHLERFGSGHLLFLRIDDTYETALDHASAHLTRRYAMDFRRAAGRYAALGRPADVAARIAEYQGAGLRHVIVDLTGPSEERDAQLERFAREVRPLLAGS
jgi:alkanesulfonate monooxygenase SsuD/methylene tetrahydromethanopterin reductase-like flavin-dependent oxidoreductase (luciferase family)